MPSLVTPSPDISSDMKPLTGPEENEPPSESLSIEERYESERDNSKIRHWKESPYAVGLVEPTWADELTRHKISEHINSGPCGESCNDDTDPTCGCISFGAIVCSRLGAKRVGNMAVLKESVESVEDEVNEEEEIDEENPDGRRGKRIVSRRKIDLVVGPYWPMLIFVTYPLIFGVSFWAAYAGLPGKHPLFILFWFCSTMGLVVALFQTGFRDPGIMLRKREAPNGDANSSGWRWNDQALTWRPRGAFYDSDCACVVEKFDHTCPWTGTAIGKKNMAPFQSFVGLVFFNLILDVYILANSTI